MGDCMELIIGKDSVLTTKCNPVTEFNGHLMILCNNMYDIMNDNNGVGLAANQVGISQRIIVVDFEPYYMINPTIISHKGTQEWVTEGCLSIPNTKTTNKRFDSITVMYQNTEGVFSSLVVDGLKSVVVQHEIDHLDGVLFHRK